MLGHGYEPVVDNFLFIYFINNKINVLILPISTNYLYNCNTNGIILLFSIDLPQFLLNPFDMVAALWEANQAVGELGLILLHLKWQASVDF